MANIRIPLEFDKMYHIYNHAIGQENLFRTDENYRYFLKKYQKYINPVANTFAYCLMPNHFHFLIQIKSEKELINHFKDTSRKTNFISKQFANLFNSYAKAFNKQQERNGKVFETDFKRIEVTDKKYRNNLVHYIHYNPVHHGFTDDLRNWKYSSYEAFFSEKTTNLSKQQVINWFDDIKNFIYFHKQDIIGFEPDFN